MTATVTSLKDAMLLDFTGTVESFRHLPAFGQEVVSLVREQGKPQTLVVIDRALACEASEPALVADHLNLTGSSPLLGPNHPCGDRFPVVQGVYITDVLPSLKKAVVAGLKHGVVPTAQDLAVLAGFGAHACCYNMVPTMLVAAHARCRLLGIILPPAAQMPEQLLAELKALVGGGK